MFCRNCGKEIDDKASFCIYCGAETGVKSDEVKSEDSGSFGWSILGCCIPIVGLVLFLVWKDTKPKSAEAAGTGALIAVIISIVFYVIIFLISVLML